MKNSFQILTKNFLVKITLQITIIWGFLIPSVFCQVHTVVLNKDRIEDYIPFYSTQWIKPITLPEVDIEGALKADIENGFEPTRFGIKIPTNLSTADGELETIGSYVIWRIAFSAPKAKSLNFEFENITLPTSAQIYIYNKSRSMISGPIESKHVHHSKYSSDIIRGNEVIIQVIMLRKDYQVFSMIVSNVIFGFVDIGPIPKEKTDSRAYDQSLPCTVDVNCDAGFNWDDERDAVALILVDNVGWCSGTLLNTTCQELEGFFLTAQHCVGGATGHLNWTFRFNYDSPNPTDINNCRGDEPGTWLTYSGADVISQWGSSGTDFGLLQLDGSLEGQPTISLAGWDRSDSTPDEGVSIGHPQADVKKISIDDDALNIEGYSGGGGSLYLRTIWDVGLTEEVSSGSALFNGFTQRIVGQLRGGEIASCEDSTPTDWFGRFFSSFTGGGTSTTRLSDWVGSASTTNTINSPFINSVGTGAPLCTTNRTYTLTNLIPGRSATWAVTPTNLFATTSGASTSGSGTSAVVRAASGSSSGLATLTFTISSGGGGCNPITISYEIWVGIPGGTLELDDEDICIFQEGIASIIWAANNSVMGVSSTVWDYDGPIDDFDGGPVIAHYSSESSGHGYISVDRTNACGTQPLEAPYQISECEIPIAPQVQVYPNPSSNNVFVSILNEDRTTKTLFEGQDGMINVFNKFGNILLKQPLNSSLEEVNLSSLPSDVYYIEVILGDLKFKNKIILIK